MNYLAHALLAWPSTECLVGSMLGDLAKGVVAPALQRGVEFHRRVDAWTDRHPMFKRSRARLEDEFGRYSAVIVDVFYDHLLAREFEQHSELSFDSFVDWVRDTLEEQLADLSGRIQHVAVRLIEHEVLRGYREIAGIRFALARISDRARRKIDLAPAADWLATERVGFAADFDVFFTELHAEVATWSGGSE